MTTEPNAEYGHTLNGILLRDFPKLAWVRATVCRNHGHLFGLNSDYCSNCGSPWFIRWQRHNDGSVAP